jgi:mRNA-degrading endonuclease RelE of RelBE toxin-antitoxin system
VKSAVHPSFWKQYSALPREAQLLADKSYDLWLKDHRYPGLHFKPLNRGMWSARIGSHYRAVGYFEDKDTFLWTWIGTHEEYNNLKF